MWRKLTVLLFLLVLAQTANALPISETLHLENTNTISQVEQHTAINLDNDEPDNLFNLPRFHQISPSLFSTEIQTTPSYILVIEFFKPKLNAGLFKDLANPPLILTWFERLSHKTNSSRLCGWKDSNSLYSSSITYYS